MRKRECYKCHAAKSLEEYIESSHKICKICFENLNKRQKNNLEKFIMLPKAYKECFLRRKKSDNVYNIYLQKFLNKECSKEDLCSAMETINRFDHSFLDDDSMTYEMRKGIYEL